MSAPSRRDFCAGGCRALALAAVAGPAAAALQACGGTSSPSGVNAPALPVIAGTAGPAGITVAVDANSPLAAAGSAALVQSSRGSFLVARTGAEAFTAVTATCTHQSCTVSGFDSGVYVCPCHGSRYDTGGRVVNGPATRALQQFPAALSGGILTISV